MNRIGKSTFAVDDELYQCVVNNDINGVCLALQPSRVLPLTFSTLTTALQGCSLELIQLLVTPIDIRCKGGLENQSLLHLVVQHNRDDVLEFLISQTRYADVNVCDSDGVPLIHCAARSALNPRLLAILINARADLNAIDPGTGASPCHWAARNRNEQAIALLIQARANFAQCDFAGDAPVHYAARNPNEKVLELLIAAGADLRLVNSRRQHVAHIAAANNNAAVMALLVAGNVPCDLSACDRYGYTPVEQCVINGNEAVLSLLLSRRVVDATARSATDATLLHLAAHHQRESIIRLLLRHGADVRACDCNGATPLHHLAAVECRDGSQPYDNTCDALLIGAGADVDALDWAGRTPLEVALSVRAHLSFAVSLVAAGACIPETNEGSKLVRDLLGLAAIGPSFKLARDPPRSERVARMQAKMARRQWILLKHRALHVCVGLQSLNVAALELCEILANAFAPAELRVPFHRVWTLVTTIKHFRSVR
jgi:ankyrin repeat protein